MTIWRTNRTGACVGVCLAIGLASVTRAAEPEWMQLFNGKNLDGWKVKLTGYELNDNFGNTFRVEEGLLKVRYDAYDKFGGRFGHIFYEQPFENYVIRVEYRFVGDQAFRRGRTSSRIYPAAVGRDRRRRGEADRAGGRQYDVVGRLDLAPSRESPRRVPQSRVAEIG